MAVISRGVIQEVPEALKLNIGAVWHSVTDVGYTRLVVALGGPCAQTQWLVCVCVVVSISLPPSLFLLLSLSPLTLLRNMKAFRANLHYPFSLKEYKGRMMGSTLRNHTVHCIL